LFSPADLHLAPCSTTLTREPTSITDHQLLAELRAKMSDRGGGKGGISGGNQMEKNNQLGQQPVWQQPQQQFPPPVTQPQFQQQPGFGYGFPPPWGFPNQFQGPFPSNQWVNPQNWQASSQG
jgi:hypothetical protein